MKKSVLVLFAALALVVSSCASYTCPTYTKAPEKEKTEKDVNHL
jgi:PBP1b-binding outer membrane lipoprotein LpoB